jgi:hypothetical protein
MEFINSSIVTCDHVTIVKQQLLVSSFADTILPRNRNLRRDVKPTSSLRTTRERSDRAGSRAGDARGSAQGQVHRPELRRAVG